MILSLNILKIKIKFLFKESVSVVDRSRKRRNDVSWPSFSGCGNDALATETDTTFVFY